MVRLSLVVVLLALAVLPSLNREGEETANVEAHLSDIEILDVADNKYIIRNWKIMPFAKCTTSSQCGVKLRQHAPGDTSNDNAGIHTCK